MGASQKNTVRQIGLVLLCLINMTVAKDEVESSQMTEKNCSTPLSEIESESVTKSFRYANKNNTTNYSESPLPNLLYKSRDVLRSFLVRHGIIPDVLAVAPFCLIEVTYAPKCIVNFGNKINPASVQRLPKKVVWPWRNDTLYTLVFVDADVPSRQNNKRSQRLHWLVVNIPGNNLDQGDHVVEYIGPIAPAQTGLHRCVFAVFKQYDRLEYKEKCIKSTSDKFSVDRLKFSIRHFATKYKLRDPFAANFFQSGWPLDQHVPEVTPPTKKPHNSTYNLSNS